MQQKNPNIVASYFANDKEYLEILSEALKDYQYENSIYDLRPVETIITTKFCGPEKISIVYNAGEGKNYVDCLAHFYQKLSQAKILLPSKSNAIEVLKPAQVPSLYEISLNYILNTHRKSYADQTYHTQELAEMFQKTPLDLLEKLLEYPAIPPTAKLDIIEKLKNISPKNKELLKEKAKKLCPGKEICSSYVQKEKYENICKECLEELACHPYNIIFDLITKIMFKRYPLYAASFLFRKAFQSNPAYANCMLKTLKQSGLLEYTAQNNIPMITECIIAKKKLSKLSFLKEHNVQLYRHGKEIKTPQAAYPRIIEDYSESLVETAARSDDHPALMILLQCGARLDKKTISSSLHSHNPKCLSVVLDHTSTTHPKPWHYARLLPTPKHFESKFACKSAYNLEKIYEKTLKARHTQSSRSLERLILAAHGSLIFNALNRIKKMPYLATRNFTFVPNKKKSPTKRVMDAIKDIQKIYHHTTFDNCLPNATEYDQALYNLQSAYDPSSHFHKESLLYLLRHIKKYPVKTRLRKKSLCSLNPEASLGALGGLFLSASLAMPKLNGFLFATLGGICLAKEYRKLKNHQHDEEVITNIKKISYLEAYIKGLIKYTNNRKNNENAVLAKKYTKKVEPCFFWNNQKYGLLTIAAGCSIALIFLGAHDVHGNKLLMGTSQILGGLSGLGVLSATSLFQNPEAVLHEKEKKYIAELEITYKKIGIRNATRNLNAYHQNIAHDLQVLD